MVKSIQVEHALSALTPLNEALKTMLADVSPLILIEQLPLEDCIGRRLATAMQAPYDVPPAANSAMDGYALNSAALHLSLQTPMGDQIELPLSQRIAAGDQPKPLLPNTAARIFTGAEIPPGADLVVAQERCLLSDSGRSVLIRDAASLQVGANIRARGQDIVKGTTCLQQGARVGAIELGVAASLGFATLPMLKPLRIAIVSTGSELIEPGQDLAVGQIYNSNRFLLSGLIRSLGHIPIDFGVVADQLQATQATLQAAAQQADVVITTGGASVGEEDHVQQALKGLGESLLWKLAIKPGKPLIYGKLWVNGTEDYMAKSVPFFGLPGNPAAVLVTTLMVVRPYLMAMLGLLSLESSASSNSAVTERVQGGIIRVSPQPGGISPERHKADFTFDEPQGRQQFLRARRYQADRGETWVEAHPNQSSGVLSSAVWGDGLAVIPIGQTIRPGELIDFYPFSKLLC